MMICSVCNKNVAVIFTNKVENGKQNMVGLCMECAKKQGIPLMQQMMQQVGMTEDQFENINKQMINMFEDIDMDEINESLENINDEENPLANMFSSAFAGLKNNKKNEYQTNENQDKKGKNTNKKTDVKDKSKKTNKKRKNLDKYGINLTIKASNNEVDRIIGRNHEIDRVIQILNRRSKNNPILIGEPGVGKTAIAEGLAVRINDKQVPTKLFDAEVYLLDLTAIVSGTQFRGQFEGRMRAIIDEAKNSGNIILVIDEVHNIMGAGEAEGGAMNAANILKPALARGEIQVIGATTLDEYRKHIEKDSALERRFQPVLVEEPTIEESVEILLGIKDYYEEYHEVQISNEVIEVAVNLSERYITDRFLPDKAIDVIDEAGSRANLKNQGLVALKSLKEELTKIIEEKELAADEDDYEKAAEYKVHEIRLREKIEEIEKTVEDVEITVEDIAYVIESWTKIPIQKITEGEADKLLRLEEKLHKRVIGQNQAISSVARTIRRIRSGFKKKRKPASFIFVGPTGVGKTELVKTLAFELFGSEDATIRVDMSEYMEKHTVSKLIGAPPGYVGYDQGGQLTEKVRRKPYSVILLDEIEKAHSDVFNMLLQILEDGRLTDNQGRTVFFENTVIIMTSNAGTNIKSNGIGFGKDGYEGLETKAKEALKQTFRPEFLNRIDEVIVFDELKRDELRQIIDLMLKEIIEEVKDKKMTIEIHDEVKDYILEKGYHKKYGARPLRRTIQRCIEDEIAEKYLQKIYQEGSHITVRMKDGSIVFE